MGKSVEIDTRKFVVRVGRRKVRPTYKEFEILRALSDAGGAVVSRGELVSKVWGGSPSVIDSRTIDQHVARLRRKVGRGVIETHSKRGYAFAA